MVKLSVSILTLLFFSLSIQAQTGSVLFKVSGIQTDRGGSISTGIFTKDNFPKVGKAFRGKDVTVTGSEMEVLLENVPIGTYGAVVFCDKNNNKKLEKILLVFQKNLSDLQMMPESALALPTLKMRLFLLLKEKLSL